MKKSYKLLIVMLISSMFIFSYCSKDATNTTPEIPQVIIDSITNITLTTADVSANVVSTGEALVTDRGICWGTAQNPTIANTKVAAGNGTGLFFSQMTGLVKGTTYYVRAYATNTAGTGYSTQLTVKSGTVSDLDGNVYDLVTINGKTWIASNLRVTKYSNGDAIPLLTSATDWKNTTTGAYCYVNNSASTASEYGLLYNWYAAFDSRGICPKGFKSVVMYSYKSINGGMSGGTGGPLKDTGYVYWKSPNLDATNSSGFSARGTGYRDDNGVYQQFNEVTYFWDVELFPSSTAAYYAWLQYNSGDFTTDFNTIDKNYGVCVRCLQK